MSTSERLIESTRELLWERGYVGTSPKAILERAGAGQGSMYHHFKGKPDLALAAIRRTAEELLATAESVLDAPGTPYERIAAYLHRERDVLRGCPIGRLTMDPDIMSSPELRTPVDETLARIRAQIAEVVELGQEQGEFAPGLDAGEIASAVVATVQGGYVLARASGSPEAFDAGVRGLLTLLAPRRQRNPVHITHHRPHPVQGPAEPIKAGDTGGIEPGARHRHGAGPHTDMSHIATVEAADDGTTTDRAIHLDPHDYTRADPS